MPTVTKTKSAHDKIGARIARTWFDTVINPLLQALKAEQTRLEKQDWTWRHFSGDFESIRPIQQMISPLAEDNLEQFTKFYPGINRIIKSHDNERLELRTACQTLQSLLEQSSELRKIYEQVKEDASVARNGEALNRVFLDGRDELHLKFLAQYIINKHEDLPDYITHAQAWNKYRDTFLDLLNLAVMKKENEKIVQISEKLRKTTTRLVGQLKQAREDLSLSLDEPYVTTTTIYG